MRHFTIRALSLLFLASVACGSPPPADRSGASASPLASTAASGTTITFAADWTQTVSQPLVAGAQVTLSYDASRLPGCRGDITTGHPGWSITAFYSVNGATPGTLAVAGEGLTNGPNPPTFVLPVTALGTADLALWFQVTSVWGCSAYDSNYGANYHFAVAPAANAPGWIGDASSIVDRATCPGPCYADAQSLSAGFRFDTWARQQAAITEVFFDVWKQGVTDFDNASLWQELDVEMHSRVGGDGAFATSYVDFAERTGNNARYAVPLRPIDLLPGQDDGALTDKTLCPTFPTSVSADGQYLQADLQFYFTVNGVELRPSAGGVFHGLFQNYLGLYAICGITP